MTIFVEWQDVYFVLRILVKQSGFTKIYAFFLFRKIISVLKIKVWDFEFDKLCFYTQQIVCKKKNKF